MIREALETRPHSLQTALQETSGLDTQDRRPHGGDEGSDRDCEIGTIHAEYGADDDWESNTVLSAHFGGQRDDATTDSKAEEHDRYSFPCGKTE